MGEAKRKALAARRGAHAAPSQPQIVDTLGGRMHVRWDEAAAATPHGQLVFFAEFLATTGVFARWVDHCPLQYTSGNAPAKRDVLGTLLLALLAGHRRYAHITALRGDAVAASALGMNKIVSEDALRRAISRIDEAATRFQNSSVTSHELAFALAIDHSCVALRATWGDFNLRINPKSGSHPTPIIPAGGLGGPIIGAMRSQI